MRDGKATLSDLIDATERRRKELDQPKPPGFFLYVDQGEELYVRAEERQRRRFSELLAQALVDPRLRTMMSMRSDFLGHLQNDRPLFKARQQIDVPPLGEEELREIVSRPAQLLAARFETDGLVDIITRRTAEDSVKDVGALPLLSYTLDDMWTQMVREGDGMLRLPAQSFELGGVLVDRADKFLAAHPDAEDALRRVLDAATRDRARGRRADAAPCRPRRILRRGVAARFRACRLSQPPSRYDRHRDGRNLCRSGARGDLPALGQAARMDRGGARISGLAQRPRSRAPRLAGDAAAFSQRRFADGFRTHAGEELARQARCRFGRRRSPLYRAEP